VPLGRSHLPPDRIRVASASARAPSAAGAQAFVQEALRWIPSEASERSSEWAPLAETALSGDRFAAVAGARILLADDNADMRSYLRELLSGSYTVEVVADGEQVLESARRHPPELILSDIMMPRLDGIALLKILRSDASLRDIPVILLSARAGEEARIEGLGAGADDYLLKPFSARELQVRVGALLELTRVRRQHERELRRAHEELKASEAALRETDQRKDEFLAMLAHELRNPLAPIANASELLARMLGTDARAQAGIQMIKRQVTQLTRLVDDLLDVSRITQGRIQLKKEILQLDAIVTHAVESVGPQLRGKQHKFSIVPSAEPLYVDGDFARLTQCLCNILINAIKYTPSGGEICIRTHGDERRVCIEVSDTGSGIPAALLPRIFDLFVQSERTLDRAEGGLGVGLAVVKRLVQMHGGQVTAHSAGPGQGSTFRVELPRACPAPAQLRAPAPAAGEPRRVLIVDDNRDAADSLALLLDSLQHQTRVAYDGAQALEGIESFQPHIALLDIGLPGMDGYQLAQRLRQIPTLKAMRIVALTGYGQAEDQARTREAGFDDHLVKPVDLAALERCLAGHAPQISGGGEGRS
jgi:signal transduction histidine kinase